MKYFLAQEFPEVNYLQAYVKWEIYPYPLEPTAEYLPLFIVISKCQIQLCKQQQSFQSLIINHVIANDIASSKISHV